jgi:hypothetical protein
LTPNLENLTLQLNKDFHPGAWDGEPYILKHHKADELIFPTELGEFLEKNVICGL